MVFLESPINHHQHSILVEITRSEESQTSKERDITTCNNYLQALKIGIEPLSTKATSQRQLQIVKRGQTLINYGLPATIDASLINIYELAWC
jgi:hypothetical protein